MNSKDFNWKPNKWEDSLPCCLWCGYSLNKTLHIVDIKDGDPEPTGDIISRKKWYWDSDHTTIKYYTDARGSFGNGFFCSKACGFRFAVAAAQQGFRLKPKPEGKKSAGENHG